MKIKVDIFMENSNIDKYSLSNIEKKYIITRKKKFGKLKIFFPKAKLAFIKLNKTFIKALIFYNSI